MQCRFRSGVLCSRHTGLSHSASKGCWARSSEFQLRVGRKLCTDVFHKRCLVEQYVVVGDKKDAEAAAELWRFGPKAFKTLYNVRDPGEIQKEADAQIPLEQVYEGWAIRTDPNVHLKKIHELFDSGVTVVNVRCGQPDQERGIQFYGKEVLPKLRR
jgi:hypothetical protein